MHDATARILTPAQSPEALTEGGPACTDALLPAGQVEHVTVDVGVAWRPAERAPALLLDEFAQVLTEVAVTLEPHRLCTYLFALAMALLPARSTRPWR